MWILLITVTVFYMSGDVFSSKQIKEEYKTYDECNTAKEEYLTTSSSLFEHDPGRCIYQSR